MTDPDDQMSETLLFVLRLLTGGGDGAENLCQMERAKGHQIVVVGSVSWLPAKDWGPRDVVALDGDEVRIVAITANRRGTGAFRRLILGIEAAGLKPVVICPFETMRGILERWGWEQAEVGHDFDTRADEWRPPAGWSLSGRPWPVGRCRTAAKTETRAGEPASRQRTRKGRQ